MDSPNGMAGAGTKGDGGGFAFDVMNASGLVVDGVLAFEV